MIAQIGMIGTMFGVFEYEWFTGKNKKKRAKEWANKRMDYWEKKNGYYPSPVLFYPDKTARKIRYQDGDRVFRCFEDPVFYNV